MKQIIDEIWSRRRYWWTLGYTPFYLLAFFIVENIHFTNFHLVSNQIDHLIPFCEWFIFFYYIWFGYIVAGFICLFFQYKRDYLKMITMLFTGMTLFIIVSYIYPNYLDLRPLYLPNRNIACVLTNAIYKMDTPTNVLPSIHVYNSIGMSLAIQKAPTKKYTKWIYWILGILITLSTVFVKQHGIVDVITAILLNIVMYYIVYKKDIYFLKKHQNVIEEMK